MPDDVVDVTDGGESAADGGADPGLPSERTSGDGAEGGEFDLERVAEDFDAEALAAIEGGRPRSARGEGADGDGRRTSTSDPVDEFIAKNYQGDRNAFVHSLYASREEERGHQARGRQPRSTLRTSA